MSQNIPGIYNYCDRWCERCCFTDRCAVYEDEKKDSPAEKDIRKNAYWHKLAENFEESIQLLYEFAREKGIDLNNIPPEESERMDSQINERKSMLKADSLIGFCREYAMLSRKILEDEEMWKRKAEEMIQKQRTGVVEIQELEDQLYLMKECKLVISWYLFFIEVKFSRALSTLIDGFEETDTMQTDFSGSAKIALVGVNRSLEAWTQLFTLIPDEDKVLPVLALLSRIEKAGREKFPNAMQFLRPGFDDNLDKANHIVLSSRKSGNYWNGWKYFL
jgi:hypothetical protein